MGWLSSLWPAPSLDVRGEAAAARYLRRSGYKIVERRSRSLSGELDIVAVDGRTVVFVEVKTRRDDASGQPYEAVDQQKQRQIVRLALAYLTRHGLLECAFRFDILSVVWPDGARRPAIEHIVSAFEPDDRWQMYT